MSIVYAYILVDSTGHALKIEKILSQYQLACKLVPVPRHLSSDCGVCVRVNRLQVEEIRTILTGEKADFQAIEET